jgi:hypothetical protein
MGRTYAAKRRTLLNYGRAVLVRGVDSNLARVKAREVWHDWGYLFSFIQKYQVPLSIEVHTCTSTNQYSLELRGNQTIVRLVLPV